MGLLQKRIKSEDIAGCEHNDKWDMVRIDYVLEIVEEMTKDFPDIGKLTSLTVTPFEMKAQEWFVKWLMPSAEQNRNVEK